jgi:murein DD-endopeptidase MepM/ murein hydrolase activator NlpD
MSFADGVVTFAGWKGGNGNLLVIEHAHGYTSLYAHLHNFARGIKKGTRVRQGQTVATLGNTGISTGPHLHFSVKKNGKYIDPAAIDTKYAITLSGTRLNAFQNSRNELKLAMTDHDTGTKSAQLTQQNTTPSL